MKKQKVAALIISGFLSISVMAGCGNNEQQSTSPSPVESSDALEGQELTEEQLEQMQNGTFRPADFNFKRAERYEYPFMGMEFTLPESVLKKMDDEEIAMLPVEARTESDDISYAFLSWYLMTEEQRQAEVPQMGTGYEDWEKSLTRVSTLGIFEKELTDNLDDITGCTEHKHLGDSDDGKYSYYFSSNPDIDKELHEELSGVSVNFTDITPFQQTTAFEQPYEEFTGTEIGEFSTTDINGKAYSHELFADNDLTLVNVFTTWCTPCVEEIPYLEQLTKDMKDKGVGVIGVVMDATEEEGLEKAKLLAERTGATYPFLIPDEGNMNGRLNSVSAYPTSFFIDKDGNIVGEEHLGSNDLEGWTEIVETTLSAMEN